MIKLDTRTVCNRIARHSWLALHADGVSAEEFTGNTGIALFELETANGRLNADQHRRLVTYAQRHASGRDWLDVGQDAWFGDYPQLANVCFNSPTLRAALLRLLEFRGLIGEFDFMLMRDNVDHVEFDYLSEFAPDNGAMQALANFKTLVLIVRCYDRYGEHGRRRFALQLQGPPPRYAAAIDEFFGGRVRYGQDRNLLRFETRHLDQPFAPFNHVLAPQLLAQATTALARVRTAHRLSARVEQGLRTMLTETAGPGAALLPRLCDQLGMAPWTLRRALQQEGTSFRALELQVKGDESRRLLQHSGLSVAEIGDRLGFSSQSAFSRFFKARHLLSPARYRHQGTGAG